MWRSNGSSHSVAFQNTCLLVCHSSQLFSTRTHVVCQFCPRWIKQRNYSVQSIGKALFSTKRCFRKWRVERQCKSYEILAVLEENENKREEIGTVGEVKEDASQVDGTNENEKSLDSVLQPNSTKEETTTAKEPVAKSNPVNKGRKSESGSRFRVLFDEIEVGQEYVGRVRKVTNYGAFIDIGCFTDGLLHVSQMSDTFVKDPAEIVKVGEEIKVRVVNKKPEKKEFSLSIRPPKAVKKREEQPQSGAKTDSEVGDTNSESDDYSKVRGRSVSRLQRMGISTHFGESTDSATNPTSSKAVSNVRKSRASSPKGSPSMRASFRKLAREADEQKFIKGTVVSITEFGAFVDFGGPSDGLIHISEIAEDYLEKDDSGNRTIKLSVGDEVQIRIIDVDINRSRISLSMKPFALSFKKQLQEDLAAANESQPEFESVLALALRKALQEKEAELATKLRH